jgi:valine dehydrogenase (NAD+)
MVGQVHADQQGLSLERARAKADGTFDVALRVFRPPTRRASPGLAEEGIRSAGRPATIRLPH